ncbi:hypothetical protein GGI12_001219 [Dipsacomyces acuminosporus]|nr:hypothetical protein GGI12_001219 [Dipsacomyces acuminosporus]
MKVPFFRSKAKAAKDAKDGSRAKETPSYARSPMSSSGNTSIPTFTNSYGASDQLLEMNEFAESVEKFQSQVERMFPENIALVQMLVDLKDECQRRILYMNKVSNPQPWMGNTHQRQSSSSSTIAAPTPRALGIDQQQSPVSTYTANSNNSSNDEFHARQNAPKKIQLPGSSSSYNTMPAPAATQTSSSGSNRRDSRIAETRRMGGSQSMYIPNPPGDLGNAKNARQATSATAPTAKFNRVSSVNVMSEQQQQQQQLARPRSRTSAADLFRPLSLADVKNDTANARKSVIQPPTPLNSKKSTPFVADTNIRKQTTKMAGAAGDYVLAVKIAGVKIESTVSSSLQASLISLSLATQMGMMVQRVPANSRVWDRNGTNWPIVGKVVGLPFVCGNMTFTHDFQVVQGSFGGHQGGIDMPRDMMLGNDFCVGNKGHIKDNRLLLQQLCTEVSVPVKLIQPAK